MTARLLIALTLLLASVVGATAQQRIRIADDRGGRIGDYEEKYTSLKFSGYQVMIDGLCASACTIVLGSVPANRICVTPNARLGFHAAWDHGASGQAVTNWDATRYLYAKYPAVIKQWIDGRGGLQPKMVFLEGRELARLYKPCFPTVPQYANAAPQ